MFHFISTTYRLNALEYQNLQDKVRGPIRNIENVQIYKSVSERFVEVFREQIQQNPRATVNEVRLIAFCLRTNVNRKWKRDRFHFSNRCNFFKRSPTLFCQVLLYLGDFTDIVYRYLKHTCSIRVLILIYIIM